MAIVVAALCSQGPRGDKKGDAVLFAFKINSPPKLTGLIALSELSPKNFFQVAISCPLTKATLLGEQFLSPQQAKACKLQGAHLQQGPQPRGVEEVVQETQSVHISAVEQI